MFNKGWLEKAFKGSREKKLQDLWISLILKGAFDFDKIQKVVGKLKLGETLELYLDHPEFLPFNASFKAISSTF